MTTTRSTTTSTLVRNAPEMDSWRMSQSPTNTMQREQRLLTDPLVFDLDLLGSRINVEVDRPEPLWLYSILARAQHLSKLPENWDSYGGVTPTDLSLYAALSVISQVVRYEGAAPAMVPLSDGGVQLEWRGDAEDLEIHIGPGGEISASRFDGATGQDVEIEDITLADLSLLLDLTGKR